MTANLKSSLCKFALLPSLFAAIALSACSDTSTFSTESEEGGNQKIINEVVASKENTANTMSAEEQMSRDLTRYRWTLAAATDQEGQSLTAITDIKEQVVLNFNEYHGQNTVSYTVGCNMANAVYELQGHTLTIQEGMSTKMYCENLNEAENLLSTLMQGDSQLSLVEQTPPLLTQNNPDGTMLEWRGRLTAQAKYNSKGKTVFWAVSADTKPCIDNRTQTCLQVKPLTYDDRGIKIDEGEWTEFAGEIDGYQHNSGDEKRQELLRLQRFEINDPNVVEATGQQHAYVLDMVVESTLVD